jgi:hypothetical protein
MLASLLLSIQVADQISAKVIQQKFGPALKQGEQIRSIGKPGSNRISKSFPISQMLLKETFASSYEKESGRYRISGGDPNTVALYLFDTGQINMYMGSFNWPEFKQPELPIEELKGYAKQALGLVSFLPLRDSLELRRIPSSYSDDRMKTTDPRIVFEAFRKTNDIAWGPGPWGKVSLVNFTGEIHFLQAWRTFNRVESTAGVLNQTEAANYAAAAVLRIKTKECSQTSLIKTGEKYITGNPFLGGQYFDGSKRVNTIIQENLGVLAYEYQFGNGDVMGGGKYGVVYDVIIDAKTGEPLRIFSPMGLGTQTPSKSPGWIVPTNKSLVIFREGKNILKLNAILVKSEKPTGGQLIPSTMQIGTGYWKVERIGKKHVKIGNDWYLLKL